MRQSSDPVITYADSHHSREGPPCENSGREVHPSAIQVRAQYSSHHRGRAAPRHVARTAGFGAVELSEIRLVRHAKAQYRGFVQALAAGSTVASMRSRRVAVTPFGIEDEQGHSERSL